MNKLIYFLALATTLAQAAVRQELNGINWGVSERQGVRREMEDAYTALLQFNGNSKEAFFGMYDGHCGDQAAIATARGLTTSDGRIPPLHELIADSPLSDIVRYINAYKQMDENFRNHSNRSGTTAVTAHIMKGINNPIMFLAWAGDARAVLVRQDGTVSVSGTTVDHKPENAQERKRIEDAGGFIFNGHVGGIMAVPRALGDGNIKDRAKGVIATPDVKAVNLLPRHHFLILACDGVWDVLSSDQAANIVQNALYYTGPLSADPIAQTREQTTEAGNDSRVQYAARALRDVAKNAGSGDNISVLVVEFNWQSEEQQRRGEAEQTKR